MNIDDNGIVRVEGNRSIDCDIPPIDKVLQNVTISDWKWSNWHVFEIVLMDTNNKQPYHDPFPNDGQVYQFEKIPSNTAIVRVEGKDQDRDVPYHTVSYEINYRDFPQLQRYFEVDSTGRVYVKENNDLLDRDAGLESIMINIVMLDNAGGYDSKCFGTSQHANTFHRAFLPYFLRQFKIVYQQTSISLCSTSTIIRQSYRSWQRTN